MLVAVNKREDAQTQHLHQVGREGNIDDISNVFEGEGATEEKISVEPGNDDSGNRGNHGTDSPNYLAPRIVSNCRLNNNLVVKEEYISYEHLILREQSSKHCNAVL